MGKCKKKKSTSTENSPPKNPAGQLYGHYNHYLIDSEVATADAEAMSKRRKGKVKQKKKIECIPKEIKAFVALVTLVLAVFDLATDGNVLHVFIDLERSYLMYAQIAVMFVSSLIFLLQVYAFYLRIKSICACCVSKDPNARDATMKKREDRFSCCNETTSYLLLIFEDVPASVILVCVTIFPELQDDIGNGVDYCQLYRKLFEESYIGWVSLLATFVVATWKIILSFFYCCLCCCEQWDGLETYRARVLCCCVRAIRPLVGFIMFGSIFYIFVNYRFGILFAQDVCNFSANNNN